MISTCRLPWIALLGFAFLFAAGTALRAEPIPMPSTDYRTKAKIAEGLTMTSRHSKGKLRVEMQMPGMPQPVVSYLDLNTKKGITVMTQPGMPPMALEADLDDDEGQFGLARGNGQRVGAATVAGESCDLWKVEPETAEDREADAVACVTHDGIVLRVEATIDGKRQNVIEVTELERAPQDPKLFTPPANINVMQMPKGLPLQK